MLRSRDICHTDTTLMQIDGYTYSMHIYNLNSVPRVEPTTLRRFMHA